MDWADEHYVKLYTRDSLTWKTWHWEARTVFLHLVRKVSSSGFIEVGTMEPAAALALQLDLPLQVVAPGLGQLLACGTAELVDRAILLPKFVEAQEAKKSEAQKKRDYRERTIAKRRAAQPVEIPTPHVHRLEPSGTGLDPPSPAQPVPVPVPKEAAAPLPLKPDNPFASPEAFWAEAQQERREQGLITEKPPHPAKLSRWWSEALGELEGDAEPLAPAYLAFVRDKYWRQQKPPCPFQGFISQWRNYVQTRPQASTN